MDMHIFHSLAITISTLAIILNSFGIYLLQTQKQKNKKQYIVIKNLSALNITIATVKLLENILFIIPINIKSFQLGMHMFRAGGVVFFLMYYQLVIFISLDRLLCVLLHMKYSYYITKPRVKKIMIIFWMVSICTLVPSSLADARTIVHIYIKYLFPILNSLFLTIFFITYSVIRWKLKKSSQEFWIPKGRKNRPNYILPLLIMLSFTLCFVIPNVVLIFALPKTKIQNRQLPFETGLMLLLAYINLLIDPFIYVLAKKNVRGLVVSILRCSSSIICETTRNMFSRYWKKNTVSLEVESSACTTVYNY